MPIVHVSRSIDIQAPVEKVYALLNDFRHWSKWSPWLIMDPKAKLKFAKGNKFYEWEGTRVGVGTMEISGEQENRWIDYNLTFLKPWKSRAKVRFELSQQEDKTVVTWKMDTRIPFFMFWMKKAMGIWIGMDYDRGLRLLKDYSEDGEVHSKLNFLGKTTSDTIKFIGVKTRCTLDTMGQKMAEDLPGIYAYLKEHNIAPAGPAFTQYHKWELTKNQVEYTSGVPIDRIPDNLPENFYYKTIPSTSVYTLEHVGPYHHLGNAWSTLYTMQRTKELNVNKKIHPLETYHNTPREVGATELVTRIHFPVID